MFNNDQIYPKRSRKSTFFYYLSLVIFFIGVIDMIYELIVWKHTIYNLWFFIVGFIISVYSCIILIMLENRPKFTSLQIKHNKSIIRRGIGLIISWTAVSAILLYVLIFQKHTL